MKNTRIIGIISVTVLLLSTITIYGYESSGNKNINTYEATQESTPSVTTIPATTTPATTNPTTKPVTTTKPAATKPKTTTAAKNNVKETTKIYNKVKSISLDKKAIRLNKGDKRTLTSYVKYKKRKKGVNLENIKQKSCYCFPERCSKRKIKRKGIHNFKIKNHRQNRKM